MTAASPALLTKEQVESALCTAVDGSLGERLQVASYLREHIAALTDELKRNQDGWAEAFRLAVQHQERADKAEKNIAALEQRVEAQKWRPIETAPKDGEPILVCSRSGHIGRATFNEAEGCFMDEHTEFIEIRWLSRWMPLPDLPKELR